MEKQTKQSYVGSAQHSIRGGIHPREYKSISSERSIGHLASAEFVLLPLKEINGLLPTLLVNVGESVVAGQALTSTKISDRADLIHAPFDGIIESISRFDLGHPSGQKLLAIKLKKRSSETESVKHTAVEHQELDANWPQSNLEKVHFAGIVGLGGAAFPTHFKLSSASSKISTLIVNAMECEPYITCDDRMLREHADEVLAGAVLTAKTVGASNVVFGIEDNKPQAIEALNAAIALYYKALTKQLSISDLNSNPADKLDQALQLRIVVAKTKYPSGGEKQLIQLVTGQQIPMGKLPASLGVLVQNVATLFAIQHAINLHKVMTKRLVTITGDLVEHPGNYWIEFGTPVKHILQQLSIDSKKLKCFIFGGPLMGDRLTNFDIPTKKSTNCIIFNSDTQPPQFPVKHQECIRCGECEVACPADLLPQQLYWFAKSEQWEALQHHQLFACIECAACSYVCPSEIPLVSYYQFAKSEIRDKQQKQLKSEQAKMRFEQRERRLARIKAEREQKRRQAAEARKKAAEDKANDPDGKKSAIAAALQRVQNKKENKQ